MPNLPRPTRLSPVSDRHAWPFRDSSGYRIHVRLRVWPTHEGSYLAIATDFQLGAGLINAAESLVRASMQEFGPAVTVVRHFPPYTMSAFERDTFEVLTLDSRGVARPHQCTAEVLDLLGPGVTGYPGDNAPGPVNTDLPVVPAQSVQLMRLLAAALRLTQHRTLERHDNGYPAAHERVTQKDLDSISHLRLTGAALNHLANFIAEINVNTDGTVAGAKRDKTLRKIIRSLHERTWALSELCDELIAAELRPEAAAPSTQRPPSARTSHRRRSRGLR